MSASFRTIAMVILAFAAPALSARAQTPQHKHYDRPTGFEEAAPTGPLAPRLQNLGVHTFPVTTSVERAQLFINQGLNLAFAFNHAEAARAFAEAARLDPESAMAYWGHALVLGPNINAPMTPDDEPKAYALAQKAVALKSKVTPREQAYIDAIAARYTGRPEDRVKADKAYVASMERLIAAYPDDLDAQVLYAEALMDLMPWSYWTRDGQPHEGTRHIIASLERVLAKNQYHPGALHLWIHLWEATDTPERAEAEADRLAPLVPGAGHMVHMPAHIYQRVGRHADVIRVNQLAAKADEDYIAQCKAQGLYPLGYYRRADRSRWRSRRRASSPTRCPVTLWPRRPFCRASWSCPTGRWSGSSNGTRFSRTAGPITRRCSRAASGTTRARSHLPRSIARTTPAASSLRCAHW
jgi:hypothetical protein